MSDREHRIRAAAHEIWEKAGRPDGLEREHWREAEAMVAKAESKSALRTAANDAPKPRALKGDAVEIGVAKPKRKATPKSAPKPAR